MATTETRWLQQKQDSYCRHKMATSKTTLLQQTRDADYRNKMATAKIRSAEARWLQQKQDDYSKIQDGYSRHTMATVETRWLSSSDHIIQASWTHHGLRREYWLCHRSNILQSCTIMRCWTLAGAQKPYARLLMSDSVTKILHHLCVACRASHVMARSLQGGLFLNLRDESPQQAAQSSG